MSGTVQTAAALLTEFAGGSPGLILATYAQNLIVSVPTISSPTVVNSYTSSGALPLTDDLSIINSASNLTMTVANATAPNVMRIKRYGSGTVTITATVDGTSSQSVLMNSPGGKEMLTLIWNTGLTTWHIG